MEDRIIMDSSIALRDYRSKDPRESPACGRSHMRDPDCECHGPNFKPEWMSKWMSKWMLKYNIQNGDKPSKAVGVTSPPEVLANVHRNKLYARAAELEEVSNSFIDEGDHYLSTVMSEILNINDTRTCTRSECIPR